MKDYFIEPKALKNGIPSTFEFQLQIFPGRMITAYAHMHDKIELLYCISGSFKAVLNGVEYYFDKGDLLLINSHEIHQIYGNSDGDNGYMVLKIEPEMLYSSSQAIFEMKYVLPFTLSRLKHPKIFKAGELKKGAIPELMQEIKREYDQQAYGYELAIRSCVCRLFLWILRFWKANGFNLETTSNICEDTMKAMQKVIDYVDNNFSNDLAVVDMAKMCNMSYSYFSRMFKRVMGQSFSEYLNNVRISNAEKMLVETDKNITEIALDTGFSNTGYFIQKFKQLKGTTPKKFKKLYVKPNNKSK